jgi:uncharacterized membrane protein
MASRRFRRELAQSLPSWQKQGWISSDGVSALRTEYSLDEKQTALGPIIRALFGAALLLGGLILLLAHNWNELGRPLRAGIAMFPLACTIALGVRVLYLKQESVALREGLALANSLALALAISLVAQTYQISGDFPMFILTWAVLTLPAAILLQGGTAWILYQALAIIWAWNASSHALVLPGYLGLALASLVVMHRHHWGESRPLTCAGLITPFFFAVTSALGATFSGVSGSGWHFIAYPAWLGIVFLASEHPKLGSATQLRTFSALGLSILLVILSFDHPWGHFDFTGGHDQPAWTTAAAVAWLVIILSGLLILAVNNWNKRDLCSWLWVGAAAIGAIGLLLRSLGLSNMEMMILVNVYAAIVAIETMRRGIQTSDTLRTNFGWLLFSALVIARFFDTELSYLLRGLVFIALGLGFLGINAWLKRRKPAQQGEVSP